MTLIPEQNIKDAVLMKVAEQMVIAARTAPKGKGADYLVVSLATQETITRIADRLTAMGEEYDSGAFKRDAANIRSCPVVVLMGTKIHSLGLKKCGMCGFENCAAKDQHPDIPCVFNTGDLGIALGSAVSMAMDRRVDNRIMYTVGQAVLDLQVLGPEVKVAYAIPLSASTKNPFFDRK
jgi:uncharacterized ferredoxin-like protein